MIVFRLKKMPAEFQTSVRFYRECNGHGSSTWLFSHDKVQTVYYYNTCGPDKTCCLFKLENGGCKNKFVLLDHPVG